MIAQPRMTLGLWGKLIAIGTVGTTIFQMSTVMPNYALNLVILPILVFATIKARFGDQDAMPFWFGFALLGWVHLLIMPDRRDDQFLFTDWVCAVVWKSMKIPARAGSWASLSFEELMTAHYLTTLLIASAGGFGLQWRIRR